MRESSTKRYTLFNSALAMVLANRTICDYKKSQFRERKCEGRKAHKINNKAVCVWTKRGVTITLYFTRIQQWHLSSEQIRRIFMKCASRLRSKPAVLEARRTEASWETRHRRRRLSNRMTGHQHPHLYLEWALWKMTFLKPDSTTQRPPPRQFPLQQQSLLPHWMVLLPVNNNNNSRYPCPKIQLRSII